MTQPTLRALKAQDIPALLRMTQALARFHGDTAMVRESDLMRDCLGPAPWLHVLVAEAAGGLCGYAALSPRVQMQHGRRGMDLHHLFVAADARRQGLGRALVQASIGLARAQGAAGLTVGTAPDNHAARAFYLAQGFAEASGAGPCFALGIS